MLPVTAELRERGGEMDWNGGQLFKPLALVAAT